MEGSARGDGAGGGRRSGASNKLKARTSRAAFARDVLARDGCLCVLCGEAATEAHHVVDRKLFADGGYDVDNGASVCEPCHLRCETTDVSCEEVRRAAGIARVVLPEGFDPTRRYDKWGNVMLRGGLRVAGPLAEDDGCRRALRSAGLHDMIVAPDDTGLPMWVGGCATTPGQWSDWRRAVAALAEAHAVGGPLAEWLFHGTSSRRADGIESVGMLPGEVLVRDDAGQHRARGSFWGTPLAAAWYAEDTVLDRDEGVDPPLPAIVAVPSDVLESAGDLVADESTFDFPDLLVSEVGEEATADRMWALSPSSGWKTCLEAMWAVALLHPDAVPPSGMLAIRSAADAEVLSAMAAADSRPVLGS